MSKGMKIFFFIPVVMYFGGIGLRFVGTTFSLVDLEHIGILGVLGSPFILFIAISVSVHDRYLDYVASKVK